MVVEFIKSIRGGRFPLVITDPKPLDKVEGMWRVSAQIATIGIFVVVLIAAIDYGRPILLPIVSAFMVGMMLGPLSNMATRAGIPSVLTGIVLWLLVIAVF